MQRLLWSVSLFALVLGLSPLRLSAAEGPALRVATFRCDATPPLGGHPLIWLRPIATVEDPLWAKGIVLDDGRARYVICSLDWCGLCNSSHRLFRSKLAAAVGTQVSRVAVQCLHQHTAPYTDGDAQRLLDRQPDPPRYVDFQFLDQLTDRLAAAAKESLGRLEVFDRVGAGQGKVEHVASSRRVVLDGKMGVRYSFCANARLRDMPEGDIDPFVKTVTLAQGGKPLVRLHYYATHPQTYYNDFRASADCVGMARERLERKEGVFQMYFDGCGGDVTLGKYNDGTPEGREGFARRIQAGIEAAVAATRWEPVDRIGWHTLALVLPARDDPGYTVAEWRAKMSDLKAKPELRVRAATAVAYAERAQQPLEPSALRLGHVYVLHLPGECLLEYQRFAQQQRPTDFVAVASYGDVGPGYICPERAFAEGGYEPTASRVAPRSETILKGAIRELLDLPAAGGTEKRP